MNLRVLLFKYWAIPSVPIMALLMVCGVPGNAACPVGGVLGAIVGLMWFSASSPGPSVVQHHQEATQQPDAATRVVPPPEHPEEPRRREKRAYHEAGHALATDDRDGKTLSINIGRTMGPKYKAETWWPETATAFDKVIAIVAGPVAEKTFDGDTKLVSEMITPGNLDGSEPRCESPDVHQVTSLLQMAGMNTMEDVLEAESSAAEVVERRSHHLKQLATDLCRSPYYLERDAIRTALGR